MTSFIKEWHLRGLVVHAKHYHQVRLDWPAMSALVERWHLQTHTFILSSFECTILLEEVEMFLGLKRTKKDEEDSMLLSLSQSTSSEILGSFMDESDINSVLLDSKGVHLGHLASWTMSALQKVKGADTERPMKGFTICLAGALLFPSEDHVLDPTHLRVIQGIWEGAPIGPAVLGYLYQGLSAAATGQPIFGSMLAFSCWVDFHFKFDHTSVPQQASKIYRASPLFHIW